MKTFSATVALLLSLLSAFPVGAQTASMYPSFELKVRKAETTPMVQVFADRTPDRGIGLWGYGQVADGYQNFYGGPTLKYDSLIEIGAGIGAEWVNGDPNWRFGTFVASFYGPLEFAWYHEMGEGKWDRVQGLLTLSDHVKAGAMGQTFYGGGPRLDVLVPQWHATFWVAPLVSPFGFWTIFQSVVFNF